MTAELDGALRDRADVLVELLGYDSSDADVATKTLSIRLRRLANHLERELRRELAAHGIEVCELEVLLALRRASGQQLSVGELLRGSQITAGAMTYRIDRLERQGIVRRDVDPADRRQVLVTLTASGKRRADCILAIKTTAEQRLLGKANPDAIARMSHDLRDLLLAIEGPAADDHPYEQCTTERADTAESTGPRPKTKQSRTGGTRRKTHRQNGVRAEPPSVSGAVRDRTNTTSRLGDGAGPAKSRGASAARP